MANPGEGNLPRRRLLPMGSQFQLAFTRDASLVSRTERFAVEFQIAANHEDVSAPPLGELV